MAPVKVEDLDATAISSLMANLDSRLQGGLHGEFYEEGSQLDDKNRHEQLPLMFELNKKLSFIMSEKEKKVHTTEDEPVKNPKAPVKGNANLISTVESIVEQKWAGRFRDLEIKLERLSESCTKTETSNKTLAAENQALKQEVKKLKQQPKAEKVTEGKFNDLQNQITRIKEGQVEEATVQHLESQLTTQRQVTGARLHALENNVALVEQGQVTESRVQVLESQLTTVQQVQDSVRQALQRASNIVDRDRNVTDDNAATCARNERSTLRDIRRLERRGEEDRDRIRALEAWQSTCPRPRNFSRPG